MPEPEEVILNRRLKLGDSIVYPITQQTNVIGLQKTITDKLPIVSSTTPQNYVEKQVWLDIGTNNQNTGLHFGSGTNENLMFGQDESNQQIGRLAFGEHNPNQVLSFGLVSESND